MSISATENAGPSPGELQDPLWVKMNAISSGITKKRKKSDAKPQSQLNKCLNEKRRRTQENLYIDELAELISATDMSSGKTDKCQILQRTVDQIRHIREQEGNNSHAVQQGEVSSSNPNILSNDQVGPILLEALDGFLFVVNIEGRVEYVTDNIIQYINYSKDDVLGKNIYNYIHHGDHENFMRSLMPTSLGWPSESQVQSRNRTFDCRFLVKSPDDKDETMEEKQQRLTKYESMQICTAMLPNSNDRLESGDVSSESSDIGQCVMCVARRISFNEKQISNTTIQQFTLKLDTTGQILAIDNSWLLPPYSQYLNKDLIGTTIQDLCHPLDLNKITAHLKDILQIGEGSTPLYRLRFLDKILNVQTKSKVFKNTVESDFIMSTYSILLGENELSGIEGGQLSSKMCSGHSSCANANNNSVGNNNNNIGGTLMNHVNGQVNVNTRSLTDPSVPSYINPSKTSTRTISTTSTTTTTTPTNESCSNSQNNPFNHHFSTNVDLDFELFPNSSWDLENSSSGCEQRPESRNTGPPNSRPPSQPAPTSSPQAAFTSNSAASVTSHCSPLRAYSPTSMIGVHSFSNSFPFSPLQDSQTSLMSVGTINGGSGSSASAAGTSATGKDSSSIGATTASPTTTATTISSASLSASLASINPSTSPTISSLAGNSAGPSTPTTTSPTAINPSLSTASTANLIGESSASLPLGSDSARLRNLLTKGVSSDDTQESHNSHNDDANQNDHRILKILLNQQDEDDYQLEHGSKIRSTSSLQNNQQSEHNKSSSLGNNMLLQLLNEKNDEDEDTRAGLKKQNELLQQLLKDPDEERKMHEQKNRDDDSLLRSLGFRSSTPPVSQSDHGLGTSQSGQKRPGDDGDLNVAIKRPMDNSHQVSSSGGSVSHSTSKLWEKNKMLASLLAKQPSQPTTIPPIPASVISATPQDKLPRVTDRLKQQQQSPQSKTQTQSQPQPQNSTQSQPQTQPNQPQSQPQSQPQPQTQSQNQTWSGSSLQSVGSTTTTTVTAVARSSLQNQPRQQLPRQAANIYLSHMLSHERTQMNQMDSSEFNSTGEFRPINEINSWDNQSSDPDLSEILDQVIDFVPDEVINDSSAIANLLDVIEAPQNNPMNEKMAINAIQKSLMLCESAVNSTSSTMTMQSTPPSYSSALSSATSVTTAHNYQPPPMYQQQRARFTGQTGIRQTSTSFSQQQQQQQQQLHLQHQRSKLMQQQQLKQRLLQQQQQQQLLIPSNATAPDQIASGIHNIDSLLNNTVAPNVSLQRSSVSDSQISQGYGNSVQMSTQHRLSHSFSHPSTISQHSVVNNNFNSGQPVSAAARLSPHSPAGMLSFSHPQPLSPKVSQGNYGNNPRMFNVNQVRAQQQPVTQQLQQRSMPSPGTVPSRQSPFPAEAFPPPASPTASQFSSIPNPANTNPPTQYRLQRTASTPTATTQLPGGIGSPSSRGLMSPSPSHRGGCPPSSTHNQHNSNNNQHFTSQHSSMLYRNSGNNSGDVQNNQFCYDQSSVAVYSSTPEDSRSLNSANNPAIPANHQIGGNTSGPGTMTSEFVRQELRAVVGARTQQRIPNNIQNNLIGQVSQDELEALGLTFEMSSAGEAVASDGPAKSWAIGTAGSGPSSSRSTMEEVVRGDSKSSLLQKLLSE